MMGRDPAGFCLRLPALRGEDRGFVPGVAVEVETEPTFSVGQSSVLFSTSESRNNYGGHRRYDVKPDDERFIMVREVGGEAVSRLILVLNFFEELRQVSPD